MPLNRTNTLFTQRWVDRLKGVPESAMVASVVFYDPDTSQAVYNPATGTYTSTPTTLWTGQARVQPIRSAATRENNANDTTVQSVLISVPIDAGLTFDLRPKHRGRVLTSPLNPLLTKFVYVVQEVLDSSNPIERTFVFSVDQEVTDAS